MAVHSSLGRKVIPVLIDTLLGIFTRIAFLMRIISGLYFRPLFCGDLETFELWSMHERLFSQFPAVPWTVGWASCCLLWLSSLLLYKWKLLHVLLAQNGSLCLRAEN